MTNIKYEHVEIRECGQPLVDLSKYSFDLDPFYFNQGLTEDSALYTREEIAEKLCRIQEGLNGHRFKIWDPWRPRVLQARIYQQYWEELASANPEWDEEKLRVEVGVFVTIPDNPTRIPPHSTGGSIDLTLVGPDGVELDMGTVFDHFGPEAGSMYYEEPGRDERVRNNRRLFREAMIEEDFRIDEDEWWHFDFGNQLWAADKGKPYAIYGEKEVVP